MPSLAPLAVPRFSKSCHSRWAFVFFIFYFIYRFNNPGGRQGALNPLPLSISLFGNKIRVLHLPRGDFWRISFVKHAHLGKRDRKSRVFSCDGLRRGKEI